MKWGLEWLYEYKPLKITCFKVTDALRYDKIMEKSKFMRYSSLKRVVLKCIGPLIFQLKCDLYLRDSIL
ncbi:hypothetical protein V1477_018538 [Vespula maculifrons]|uniref:Uncharacterized protein n=1 Tax=Vespula maculifrons TaxID=7453 RepID=A0ABD2AVN4_VESMC